CEESTDERGNKRFASSRSSRRLRAPEPRPPVGRYEQLGRQEIGLLEKRKTGIKSPRSTHEVVKQPNEIGVEARHRILGRSKTECRKTAYTTVGGPPHRS